MATPTTKKPTQLQATATARAAAIRALMARLEEKVAAAEAAVAAGSEDWGHAGDLGHYEASLKDMLLG